jgi:hypothetical protein
MENLVNRIQSSLRKDVLKYTHLILNKYIDTVSTNFQMNRSDLVKNIDMEELLTIWDNINIDQSDISLFNNKKIKTDTENKLEVKTDSENKLENEQQKDKDQNKCQFILLKGNRKGQLCGSKNKLGENYCVKHIKKSIQNITSNKNECSEEINRKIYLHFNKELNRWIEKSTNLVFKSKEEKRVIGKLINGNIQPLDDSSIELCNQYSFRYEKI